MSESHVTAVEFDQFGHMLSGLDGQQRQGAVSAAFPTTGIGRVDQGVDASHLRDSAGVRPKGRAPPGWPIGSTTSPRNWSRLPSV
ncbi:hypothetical protein [Allokutzneria oryzae]|uniref:Uncharacterized protein n=1 Tax=Allokutzneria oryzae TaxID=1378989 RepID=A0ABV5ZX66_9PSEU